MSALLFVLAALAADEDAAEPVDTVALQQQKHADEQRLSGEIRDLVVSICGGRCELLTVEAEVSEKKDVRDRLPGFEKMAKVDKRYVLDKATIRIAADNKLSASSKSGLIRAIKGKLQDAAPAIDVQIQPFDWPTPRADAPTPIVLTTQGEERKAEPAPVVAPPPLPTPKEKLLLAFATAAPKLLALFAVLVFISIVLSQFFALWRKREEPPPAPVIETASAPIPAVSSPLLDECMKNNTFKIALFRRALREATAQEVAKYMRVLGVERVPELHDGPYAARLAEAYRALRTVSAPTADAATALEQLWLQLAPETSPDARFAALLTLDARAFYLLCEPLGEEEQAALLLLAPGDLRDTYVASLGAHARQLMIERSVHAAQFLREPRLSVLAQKIESSLTHVRTQMQVQDRAVTLLQNELVKLDAPAQAAFMERLQHDDAWKALVDRAVVTEDDLLALDETTLANFIVSVPPQALCTFLVGATAATTTRVVPTLPRYLRPIYDEEAQRTPSDELLADARRVVFSALLTLKLSRAPSATHLELVAVK